MTMHTTVSSSSGALLSRGLLLAPGAGLGQAPPPYGTPIAGEHAKKLTAGVEGEAKKNNWPVAISAPTAAAIA